MYGLIGTCNGRIRVKMHFSDSKDGKLSLDKGCTKTVPKISGLLFTTVSYGTIFLTEFTSSQRAGTKNTPAHCSTWLDMDSMGSVLCWVRLIAPTWSWLNYTWCLLLDGWRGHVMLSTFFLCLSALTDSNVSLTGLLMTLYFIFKRSLTTIDDSGADDFNHAHALIPITRRRASQFNSLPSFVDAHEF